jgi:hypothetical protein
MVWREAFHLPARTGVLYFQSKEGKPSTWRPAEIDYPDSHAKNNVQDRAGDCRR